MDAAGYEEIGLVGNPYELPEDLGETSVGVTLAVEAAAASMLSAVHGVASQERSRPIHLVKSGDLPNSYHIRAMSRFIPRVASVGSMRFLPVYVPLIMMRMGRVRGPFSMLAEILTLREVDLTLAEYARQALSEPDSGLPEWTALDPGEVAEALDRIASDPAGWVAETFGAPEDVRVEDRVPEIDRIMRESTRREQLLEPDPEEQADSVEIDDGELEASPEVIEHVSPVDRPLVRYVLAHIKQHLSPVLARGLRSYVTHGTAAMTQELKITRAPRKTLAALGRFARYQFDKVVLIFDNFEGWDSVPESLRAEILGGLTEIRYSLGPNGILVIAGGDGNAPEVDEHFAGAIRVRWDMEELDRVFRVDAPNDLPALHGWLDASALPDVDVSELHRRVEQAVAGAGDLASAARGAFDVVEETAIAARGAASVER
jgi:hypothetical protein